MKKYSTIRSLIVTCWVFIIFGMIVHAADYPHTLTTLGCNDCHKEASDPSIIVSPPPNFCWSCHNDIISTYETSHQYASTSVECLTCHNAHPQNSDLNSNGVVNEEDIQLFSFMALHQDWEQIDWCRWLEAANDERRELLGTELQNTIFDWFRCGIMALDSNRAPIRLAWGPGGKLFVSDEKTNSVFIYDINFNLYGQLRGLDKPLGVAVDSQGKIYVGNHGRQNIEKYDQNGVLEATIGAGVLEMPNDLVFDQSGRLYVADSPNHTVRVFNPDGTFARNIGSAGDGVGQLNFPVAVAIDDATGALYVADQGHFLVQVFDLQGYYLRSFGGFPTKGGMMGTTWEWEGKFIGLQSLAFDAEGKLHALDSYMSKVQILDPISGAYQSFYESYDSGAPAGYNFTLDIAINLAGNVYASNYGAKRVELINTIP